VAEGAKLYTECKMELATATITTREQARSDEMHLPDSFFEPHWYAAYTCANHEKQVAAELRAREVEHFLPLYSSVRRWRDRRVSLELPLFPGYVFVRIALRDRLRVLQLPSVVRLVGFGGYPIALPDVEIQSLRSGLGRQLRPEPHPFLTAGRHVRIKSGPLAGLEGVLLRRKGGYRVVVSIELIQRSIIVDTDTADVEPEPSMPVCHATIGRLRTVPVSRSKPQNGS
jgi:transcription antitermination factor NusG